MRAAGITARGGPVEILEVDEPASPGPDEVLLDIPCAGIGNWDELVRIGSRQVGGPAPMALGTEAAGTVVAAGSRVAEVRAERSPFPRSPQPRRSTRLSRSNAAAGSSSTGPAESRVAFSSSLPRPAAPG